MKTIIAGSRTITDYRLVEDAVKESGFEITTVISGAARGVDWLGEKWALERDIPVEFFPADWNKYGKKAGYLRNEQMARVGEALVAITTGSPGTAHMIKLATENGLKVYVKNVHNLL